jgi:hypothetical protein
VKYYHLSAWDTDFFMKVVFAVYDPVRGWRLEECSPEPAYEYIDTTFELTITDGIVFSNYYVKGIDYPIGWDFVAIYDPGSGSWKKLDGWLNDALKDGFCAYVYTYYDDWDMEQYSMVIFGVYDPVAGSWKYDYKRYLDHDFDPTPQNLALNAGTVTWTDPAPQKRGYDPATGAWVSGQDTKPLAAFVIQPNSGKVPLTSWFTDMSLLGSSWAYNFGDGTTSTARSTWHTYTYAYHHYQASLMISGPTGSDVRQQTVTTLAAAMPFLQLLLLD